ncbi:hypothetical protein BYT27DRAFT_7101798 [Phlegmacium glaucopus]|nr:hypothetical protein BYT27DRAFT_7101798 [Phlegmacium glaucopus]
MLGHLIPHTCIQAVKILGALCAMLLISGICPDPFNPLLFLFIIYKFNIHSLDCEAVGKWYSELRQTIDSWLAVGASGDVTPFRNIFCSYLNMDVTYAPEILHAAIIGPEPPSHPEIQSFAKGFSLSCQKWL